MGDGPRGIEVFADHFQASTSGSDHPQNQTSSTDSRTNSYLRIGPTAVCGLGDT